MSLCAQKPAHKLHVFIAIHSHTLAPAKCLLDTGVDFNLTNASLAHKERTSRIKHMNLPRLHTATRKLIQRYETILLERRVGDLATRVCFGIISILAVSIILGTSFVDRSIRGIFF